MTLTIIKKKTTLPLLFLIVSLSACIHEKEALFPELPSVRVQKKVSGSLPLTNGSSFLSAGEKNKIKEFIQTQQPHTGLLWRVYYNEDKKPHNSLPLAKHVLAYLSNFHIPQDRLVLSSASAAAFSQDWTVLVETERSRNIPPCKGNSIEEQFRSGYGCATSYALSAAMLDPVDFYQPKEVKASTIRHYSLGKKKASEKSKTKQQKGINTPK